jgi:ATPase subunit of ABC transporter with duplicated ATPase domains
MMQPFLKFNQVTFGYDASVEPLFRDVTVHLCQGWTGIVGANGAGKTTFLKLATGLLPPDSGMVTTSARTVYCPQRTDDPPERFAELLEDPSGMAALIRGRFGVEAGWLERWPTLSHGERKRAQIAAAFWLKPKVLAIDEPTNHVDAEARNILIEALRTFRGVGLLVSHDRELLDTLCTQCVFIQPPGLIVRPGGYSQGRQQAAEDDLALRKKYDVKKKAFKKLRREAGRRRDLANHSKLSKKGIAKHDHDAKAKIDGARVSGKDAIGGKLLHQLDGRLGHLQDELEDIHVTRQHSLGIWLPGSVSRRDALLDVQPMTLPLGDRRHLVCPRLAMRPTDRVALTGPNGGGKSTLLRWLLPRLNAPPEQITYVPQEIDVRQCRDILRQARELPHEQLGHLMTIVSRQGSRPERLLESVEPSPGETRKLMLALGLTRKPHVVVMDEPTNHMDLPSIECLEDALSDCPCSLLLVSHDRRFLEKLTRTEWKIVRKAGDGFELQVL